MDPLNAEFCRLLQKSGWSQSEAARALRVSPGVVSQYVKGQTRPSETVLSLLKILTGDRSPMPGDARGPEAFKLNESASSLAEWEAQLLDEIRALPDGFQREVATLFQNFAALCHKMERPDRIRPKKGA